MAIRNRMPPWHENFTLPNGRTLLLRPVRPEDGPPLQGAFSLLEPEEIRQRFVRSVSEITPELLQRLTHPNPKSEIVLVAAEQLPPGEALIGAVARATITPDTDDSADTQLQHIRDRMHLIDTAGTPDPSTVQAYVAPTPVPVPVVTSPEVADTAVQTTPLVTQRSTALPGVTTNEPKSEPAISEDDTQPVAAVPTETTAAVMPAPAQDDSTDSDSSSPPPMDALGAWTPTASPAVSSDTAQVNTNNPSLTAAVGSSQWQSGLSQQVLNLHQRGKDRVDLQLHPADLGPLSISLKQDTSGTQAQFVCAHPAVRSAVEQALPQLREALAAQGITLGETSVSDQPSRQARDQQVPYVPSTGASVAEEETSETVATPLLTRIDLYT